MSDNVQRIGCGGHTYFVLIDGRYVRWRCTDRNCPDVERAYATRQWAFHVRDIVTGEQWTEMEPIRARAA